MIAAIMIWFTIFGLEIMATGGSTFASTGSGINNPVAANSSILQAPTIVESTNIFTAAWAVITGVAAYFKMWIQVLFLWCPTVFSGYLLWVYWFICFPFCCGIIFGIVTMLRGVHSS